MKKLFTVVILPLIIIGLAYYIYQSVQKPIAFNKEVEYRKVYAVQKLKDIRTLQVAFKNQNNRFAPSIDTLIDFYKNGKMQIVKMVGSSNDSLAVAHTEAVKKAHRGKITAEQLYELYLNGDKNLVFSIPQEVAVKDTLLKRSEDEIKKFGKFEIDELADIPFSNGEKIEMKSVIKQVSGVNVPLFEACIPFDALLKDLDHQLLVNLKAEKGPTDRYPNRYAGYRVGSIDQPNNNAGNWE